MANSMAKDDMSSQMAMSMTEHGKMTKGMAMGRYESASGEVYVGEYEDNNRTGANHFSNEEKEAQRFRIEKEAPYDEIKYLLEQEGWIVKAAFFFGGYNITNPEGKKYQAETLSDLRELYRNIINPH